MKGPNQRVQVGERENGQSEHHELRQRPSEAALVVAVVDEERPIVRLAETLTTPEFDNRQCEDPDLTLKPSVKVHCAFCSCSSTFTDQRRLMAILRE